MIAFILTGEVLEMKQSRHSFTDNRVSYTYFNIRTWHKSTGDEINSVPHLRMQPHEIEWAKKRYLPQVGIAYQPEKLAPASDTHDEADSSTPRA
jgi:hypothetical protein